MNTIINFLGIKFYNYNFIDIEPLFGNKTLICAPSGPGLAEIDIDINYKNALKNADINIFDSGIFVLLLALKSIHVRKYSGFLFFDDVISYFKKNKINDYLFVDPNKKESLDNSIFMNNFGVSSQHLPYIAPIYKSKKPTDKILLDLINNTHPKFIIINLGGGVQEKLGYWLKTNLNYNATIICTGAAISFYTGNQAKIPFIADKLFLGWFFRIFYNPKIFIKRYFFALRFIFIFFKNIKNIQTHKLL